MIPAPERKKKNYKTMCQRDLKKYSAKFERVDIRHNV